MARDALRDTASCVLLGVVLVLFDVPLTFESGVALVLVLWAIKVQVRLT